MRSTDERCVAVTGAWSRFAGSQSLRRKTCRPLIWSAMDGYAIRLDDDAKQFEVVGEICAGQID